MTKTELRKVITPILRKFERERIYNRAFLEAMDALVSLIRNNQPKGKEVYNAK